MGFYNSQLQGLFMCLWMIENHLEKGDKQITLNKGDNLNRKVIMSPKAITIVKF